MISAKSIEERAVACLGCADHSEPINFLDRYGIQIDEEGSSGWD
ncbi:MAG TPA: hypothetical protein VEC35_09170 [Noviherbaspirillum sp.]|nr:hypothetical protein [Noviherbaspirillum sp.]